MPRVDVTSAEIKSGFSKETIVYYEICRLVSEVVIKYNENKIKELNKYLAEKGHYFLSLQALLP